MNITNLSRDQISIELDSSKNLTVGSDSPFSATQFTCNNSTIVNDTYGNAQVLDQALVAAGGSKGAGLLMAPPWHEDNTPYRVIVNATPILNGLKTFIAVGYAPANPTGTNDTCVNPRYFAFENSFDGVLMIPNVPVGDPDYGKPLAFSCQFSDGEALGLSWMLAHISVQNISKAAPPFAASNA